jgi:hypothetical protein
MPANTTKENAVDGWCDDSISLASPHCVAYR